MATNQSKPKSLATLVRIYRKKAGLPNYLRHYEQLKSIDDAIRDACLGANGKVHGHQRRVGRKVLTQASKVLLRHAAEIETADCFDELIECVHNRTGQIDRFGVLAVYDTSLRLGAFLDRWPEFVYLHAGTMKGAKKLGLDTTAGYLQMGELPKTLQSLEPFEVEDFLCIFKDDFVGLDGERRYC